MKFLLFGLTLITVYNLIISTFGIRRQIRRKIVPKKIRTFTIIIPCHNEDGVIYNTLKALTRIDYPLDKFTVCVFMDNCTDGTEDMVDKIMSEHKMNILKVNIKGGTKPKCIKYGIEYLVNIGRWDSDCIMILDADNIISSTMLKTFNGFHEYYDVLQCSIQSKNSDGVIAGGFDISFKTMEVCHQMARNNIGLSALLSGTGFSITRHIFDKYKFTQCDTLTEDLEFGVKIISEDIFIRYVPIEYVLNEHVVDFKSSVVQRIRWCRGHVQVAFKMTPTLIKRIPDKPLQMIDLILLLNVPIFTLLMVITSIIFGEGLIFLTVISIIRIVYTTSLTLLTTGWGVKYIVYKVFYSISMWFCILIGLFTFKDNKWAKTKHGVSKKEN